MHIRENGVLQNKLNVILWDAEDQVNKRLPNSPSFDCWLQEIINGNLLLPFLFSLHFLPTVPSFCTTKQILLLPSGMERYVCGTS